MSNSYAATLALLTTPDLDYALDEASGSYENGGGSGALDLTQRAGNPMFQAPGIIRNAPYEYGIWNNPNSSFVVGSDPSGGVGSPAVTGWSTGTFSVFAMRFGPFDGDDFFPFAMTYRSGASFNTNNGAGFVINENGRLFFVINRSIDASQNNSMLWTSTATTNVVEDGKPYHLACVQRGDGTGLHVFVNGVEEAGTTTPGASADADGFMDVNADAGRTLAGPFVINGQGNGNTTTYTAPNGGHAIVQRPAVWRNTALTDAQIAALHVSANLQGTPTDYYEYMLDRFVVQNSSRFVAQAFYLQVGWLAGVGGSQIEPQETGAVTTVADEHNRLNWDSEPTNLNDLDTTQRQSAYPVYSSRLIDGAPRLEASADDLDNQTQGTYSVLVTLRSSPTIGQLRGVMGYGEGTAGDDENVMLWFGGNALGVSIRYTIGEQDTSGTTTGDHFTRTVAPGDDAFPAASLPEFALLTIAQDGTEIKMYKNGIELDTFVESSSGLTFDASSWTNALASPSSPQFAIGYPGGTGHAVMDVHQTLVLENVALTQAQISEMWDAINGILPAGDNVPPPGGFNDTLVNTGNPTDPNGPGPDHYWRLNATGIGPIVDVGISTIDGTSILTGGDPLLNVNGPLINDPTNRAIFFDGAGDYFEIGRNLVTGRLVTDGIGTVGFFVSNEDFTTENIAYSQADAAGAERITFGVNAGKAEVFVQTSSGNSARLTATNAFTTRGFFFVVITNDGSDYKMYIDGVEDTTAVLATEGTGAEGDWFDTISGATRSAVAALATSGFTTETTGRFSELFIYDEVLTAGQIATLFEAAVQDGINTSSTLLGVLSFSDVTFENGGLADVRVVNPLTTFNQTLLVDHCRFLGGTQGAAAQSILASGEARVQVRGSSFDLNETPVAGRAAFHGTVADPTASATTFGSAIVSDSTFNRMGRAADPALYLEAGFGMTVGKSRFFDTLTAAIGWRGDARRVNILSNLIDTVTSGVGGVYVRAGLNTQIGTVWNVQRNTILDVAVGDGLSINGFNSSSAQRARTIRIAKNLINTVAGEYIDMTGLQDAMFYANTGADGAVDGMRVRDIAGVVDYKRNAIRDQSGEGIRMEEGAVRTATLVLVRNTINGVSSGDGIQVSNVAVLEMVGNDLVNLANGLTLGTISTRAKARRNNFSSVATPLVLSGTQAGLDVGQNNVTALAAIQALTVATEAVNVSAPFHTVTSGSVTNLTDIGGPDVQGAQLVLLLATGSSNVTLVDGANLVLAGNFEMNDPGVDNIWLVYDGTNWVELDRRSAA